MTNCASYIFNATCGSTTESEPRTSLLETGNPLEPGDFDWLKLFCNMIRNPTTYLWQQPEKTGFLLFCSLSLSCMQGLAIYPYILCTVFTLHIICIRLKCACIPNIDSQWFKFTQIPRIFNSYHRKCGLSSPSKNIYCKQYGTTCPPKSV